LQPCFCMSRGELEDVLHQTKFKTFQITSHVCQSPLWSGRHLECIASKEAR
jgi:hypothetical protein